MLIREEVSLFDRGLEGVGSNVERLVFRGLVGKVEEDDSEDIALETFSIWVFACLGFS